MSRPWITMTWRNLLFAHWAVDAALMRTLLPPQLELDTFDGKAWIGLIPFEMTDVRPRIALGLPIGRDFLECNVRTYARVGDVRGVYFLSLDATHALAVGAARRFFGLNYRWARMSTFTTDGITDYRVTRRAERQHGTHLRYRPLEPIQPTPLQQWATERYALFTVSRRGAPRIGRIEHRPWSLRRAELLHVQDSLISAAGVGVSGPPQDVCYADAMDVRAWSPRSMERA